MSKYQKVKGTQDFFGSYITKFRLVENMAKQWIERFGFLEIQTPIFENTDVFSRSVGDETDIVTKEMYTFLDKGNRSITLRPEGTAAVARSFIENKLYAQNLACVKLFYFGPMFRYERPQAGRFREFNQFGVEAFGIHSPLLDSDVIMSAYFLFKKLGIQNTLLKINSIGDQSSRLAYAQALKEYFAKEIDHMCSDCARRLHANPMRILDCKIDAETPAMKKAPKMKDFLTEESRAYFADVLKTLDSFQIPYEVDYNLVRGLDYYTDTVFEFVIQSEDALHGLAICAGGKYADLIQSLGGPSLPGIGYAIGVERIVAVMDQQNTWPKITQTVDVVVIGLDEESKALSLKITNTLRLDGFICDLDYVNTNLKSQFKLAERLNARFIIIVGEEERTSQLMTIKDTLSKTQEQISIDKISGYLKEKI